MIQYSPKKWRTWLPSAELWYNSNFHTALDCSPFKALYGYDANVGMLLPVHAHSDSAAVTAAQDRDNQLAVIKQRLAAAQNRMKV